MHKVESLEARGNQLEAAQLYQRMLTTLYEESKTELTAETSVLSIKRFSMRRLRRILSVAVALQGCDPSDVDFMTPSKICNVGEVENLLRAHQPENSIETKQ